MAIFEHVVRERQVEVQRTSRVLLIRLVAVCLILRVVIVMFVFAAIMMGFAVVEWRAVSIASGNAFLGLSSLVHAVQERQPLGVAAFHRHLASRPSCSLRLHL